MIKIIYLKVRVFKFFTKLQLDDELQGIIIDKYLSCTCKISSLFMFSNSNWLERKRLSTINLHSYDLENGEGKRPRGKPRSRD